MLFLMCLGHKVDAHHMTFHLTGSFPSLRSIHRHLPPPVSDFSPTLLVVVVFLLLSTYHYLVFIYRLSPLECKFHVGRTVSVSLTILWLEGQAESFCTNVGGMSQGSAMNLRQKSLWWFGRVVSARQVTDRQLLTSGSIKICTPSVSPAEGPLQERRGNSLPGSGLETENPGPNPLSWTSRPTYLLFPATKGSLSQEWEPVPQSQRGRFSPLKGRKSLSVSWWKSTSFPTDPETKNELTSRELPFSQYLQA